MEYLLVLASLMTLTLEDIISSRIVTLQCKYRINKDGKSRL